MNGYLSRADVVSLVQNLAAMDGRVVITDMALSVWADNLEGKAQVDVQTAVRNWFREERHGPPTPAGIRKLSLGAKEARVAKSRAIAPPAREVTNPMTYRGRNPEEWDRLYELGRREGDEMRARNSTRLDAA